MAIYIPDKVMRGRPVDAPGTPEHGRVLLKHPSGIIVPSSLGRPTWVSSPYAGSSILDPAPAGFTNVPTSGDSRLIYVDPEGSDSADGSTPGNAVKTLNRARNLQRSGYPDRVMLKCGAAWRENFSGWKSGNPSMAAVVGWYGSPSDGRPRIETLGGQNISSSPITNTQFHGLEFYHYASDVNHPEYDASQGGGSGIILLGGYDNIVFEDCKFNHSEIAVQAHHITGERNGAIYLLWCIHVGKYKNTTSTSQSAGRPSNVYINGCDKLVIQHCVADHGGWSRHVPGAGANQYCHNYYLNYSDDSSNDLTFSDNIVTRGSSHGVQVRPGGIASHNFLGRNALGILMGYGQKRFVASDIGHVLDNVVTEGVNMYKGHKDEIDICQNGLCSRAVYGIDFDLNGTITAGNFQCKRNIVHTIDPAANASGLAFFGGLTRRSIWYHNQQEQTITDVVDEDNIAWRWASETEGTGVNYRDPGRTLSDYYKHLNGIPEDPADRFDDFMQEVLNRPPRSRDENYESRQINTFIRQGFEVL